MTRTELILAHFVYGQWVVWLKSCFKVPSVERNHSWISYIVPTWMSSRSSQRVYPFSFNSPDSWFFLPRKRNEKKKPDLECFVAKVTPSMKTFLDVVVSLIDSWSLGKNAKSWLILTHGFNYPLARIG